MNNEFHLIMRQLERIETLSSLQKSVLTFDDACMYTGMSKSSLYKLTSAGKIPHSKPTGKLIFFDRKELEDWLLNNPIRTEGELEKEASSYCTQNSSHKQKKGKE
jgi:excisionase family DNA binding protein